MEMSKDKSQVMGNYESKTIGDDRMQWQSSFTWGGYNIELQRQTAFEDGKTNQDEQRQEAMSLKIMKVRPSATIGWNGSRHWQ